MVGAVDIEHPAAERTSFGLVIGAPHHFIQSAIVYDGVRVQDQDIFATTGSDTYVIGLGEPQISSVFDQPHLRIVLANEIYGPVC